MSKHFLSKHSLPKRLPVLIIALLSVLPVCFGCSSSGSVDTESASFGSAQLANPVVEVKSAEDFEALGFAIDAPAKAQDVSYSIISGTLAQVRFTSDAHEYTYRAAKTSDDISGVYEDFEENTVSIAAGTAATAVTITVKTAKAGGKLALWRLGEVSYSLWTADDASIASVAALSSALAESAIG